jgi:hypothetical protein
MALIDASKIMDREAEAEIFNSMLRYESPRRVLVVSDRGGMGKSTLLRKLRYLCDVTHSCPVALVDLREFKDRPDVFKLVRALRNELNGGGIIFPRFDAFNRARAFQDPEPFRTWTRPVQGAVDARQAQVGGQTRVAGVIIEHAEHVAEHVGTRPWNDQAENEAQALCCHAFLEDLLTYTQGRTVVLLFDTVEANEELRRWIILELIREPLVRGYKDQRLIVVLAGQDVAELITERLGTEGRECTESIASLSNWDLDHVTKFLKVNGFINLNQLDYEFIHDKLSVGYTLHQALLIAQGLLNVQLLDPGSQT